MAVQTFAVRNGDFREEENDFTPVFSLRNTYTTDFSSIGCKTNLFRCKTAWPPPNDQPPPPLPQKHRSLRLYHCLGVPRSNEIRKLRLTSVCRGHVILGHNSLNSHTFAHSFYPDKSVIVYAFEPVPLGLLSGIFFLFAAAPYDASDDSFFSPPKHIESDNILKFCHRPKVVFQTNVHFILVFGIAFVFTFASFFLIFQRSSVQRMAKRQCIWTRTNVTSNTRGTAKQTRRTRRIEKNLYAPLSCDFAKTYTFFASVFRPAEPLGNADLSTSHKREGSVRGRFARPVLSSRPVHGGSVDG